MNEGTWLKYPPPEDLVQYIETTMANAEFLTQERWEALLKVAGLGETQVKVIKLSMLEQWRNQIGVLSPGDKRDILKAFKGFFLLLIKYPGFRKLASEISPSPGTVRKLLEYLGYGLYVGKKYKSHRLLDRVHHSGLLPQYIQL